MSGPSSQLLNVGDEIAQYRVEAYVARGGMAVIYRARDMTLGRPVALKLIAPELAHDDNFRQRFTRESELAASIDHPHIIPIYQAGEFEGMLFIAMRFVEGKDLGSRLQDAGELAPDVAMPIFTQVAGALDAAHARGLVHRDVKPGNILISHKLDETDHVYLTDFGLTKRSLNATRFTNAGHFLGTIQYVAPEQIANRPLDARADVYSLACVMYEALSGRPPFVREDDAALLFAHLAEPPAPISLLRRDLPPGVSEALTRALAKDPDARTQSCRELIADLHSAFREPTLDRGAAAPVGRGVDAPQAVVPPAAPTAARGDPAAAAPEAASRPAPPQREGAAAGLAPPDSLRRKPVPPQRARAAPEGGGPPGSAGSGPPVPARAARPDKAGMPPPDARGVGPVAPVTPPLERAEEEGPPPPGGRRFSPVAIVLSAAALVVLVALAALSLFSERPSEQGGPTATTPPRTTPPATTPRATTPPATTPPAPGAGLPAAAVALPAQMLIAPRRVGDDSDLYRVDTNGDTKAKRLTTSPKAEHAPVLSPDRRTLAYLATTPGPAATATTVVRVMASDGTGDRRLFKNPARCRNVDHLTWNPNDPEELALICERASGQHSLLAVRVDGTVLRAFPVPRGSRRVDDPSYSPDGGTIVFWAGSGAEDQSGALFTVAASGTEPPRRLTDGPNDLDPAWSAAGDRIAFTRVEGPTQTSIYLIDADGSRESPLVPDGVNEKPTWAGEGTSIVFVKEGASPQTEADLFLVDADNGRPPRSLNVPAIGFGTPVWGFR